MFHSLDVSATSSILASSKGFRRFDSLGLWLLSTPVPAIRDSSMPLGVYHNALRYLRQLGNDPRFQSLVEKRDAERLIVASLLHDLGHWPFCHPIEDSQAGWDAATRIVRESFPG